MVRGNDLLRCEFAIDDAVESGLWIYLFKFVPRYARTFVWRAKFIMTMRIDSFFKHRFS